MHTHHYYCMCPPVQNDVPPPGAYYRRSTLERDGKVCGSVSAKGYGTGFVSTAPRFRDLKTLQQTFLPGPGSYMTESEGPPGGGKLTSFSSLKRVRYSCAPKPFVNHWSLKADRMPTAPGHNRLRRRQRSNVLMTNDSFQGPTCVVLVVNSMISWRLRMHQRITRRALGDKVKSTLGRR